MDEASFKDREGIGLEAFAAGLPKFFRRPVCAAHVADPREQSLTFGQAHERTAVFLRARARF
jgi:hypothetical protein